MKANATDLPPPAGPAGVAAPPAADAVTALYQAHALGLIRLAVVMLGDRAAAEDAVQEAFCGLYRRWHSLSDPGKALSYVRSSVINGCRTALRRRKRQARLAGDPPGESAQAAADTVAPDSVPPLELPAPRPRRLGRWLRAARSPGTTWTPWAARLTPWAAALAVIAIVITMVTLSPPAHQGGLGRATSTASRPDVPLGPPVSTYVRSGQVPPYFVTRTPSDAVVHLTDGGATVATIRPSRPGGKVVAVTAAGDDRTFVLAEQAKSSRVAEFYQVRLSASGHPGAPTRLPMSVADVKTMTDMALSPDGTRLAIAVAPGGGLQQVRLYSVHSGSARTWSATGSGTIGGRFAARSLSWAASQRTLAFNWSIHQTKTVRLLDIGDGGGSLLAASQPAVMLAATTGLGRVPYQCLDDMLITPNGSAIVCPSSKMRNAGKNGTITYSTGFPEFSVTTGSLIRIVGHWPQQQDDPYVYDLLWSDASGRVLIGAIHSAGRDWVGVISGNRFTPLSNQQSLGTYQFGTW